MDNANTLVTIFGGSGFVGTQLVQALARRGYRIRVAVRRPDLAGHVRMLGSVGQVMPIQANVRNADSVARAVQRRWRRGQPRGHRLRARPQPFPRRARDGREEHRRGGEGRRREDAGADVHAGRRCREPERLSAHQGAG
jgi:hypothetical protein